jgi:hypothetical protein
MSHDRSYIEENAPPVERLRDLVAGLTDEQLQMHVNEDWTPL